MDRSLAARETSMELLTENHTQHFTKKGKANCKINFKIVLLFHCILGEN